MEKIKVILLSGKAESGKTSVAKILKKKLEQENKKVLLINFADYLKFVSQKYLGWNGIKDKKGRGILQFVGTDLARKKQPDFWADTVARLVFVLNDNFDYFIADDARFIEEMECFKDQDVFSTTIKIVRLNYENSLTEKQKQHLSETSLDNFLFDYIIKSESGLDYLEKEVDKFLIQYNNNNNNRER